MGHFLFIIQHLVAILFGMLLLFVTIPLHLIYAAVRSSKVKEPVPTPKTHHHCPECPELIRLDARVCRFCNCKLEPQPIYEGLVESVLDKAVKWIDKPRN